MAEFNSANLAPREGYDTKYMMERMCIGSNRLEAVVEKDESFLKSGNFKQMVRLESHAAKNYNDSREEPEDLKKVTRIIEGNLATLSTTKDPTAILNKNNFTAEYAPDSNQIAEFGKERAGLVTKTKECRAEQMQVFSKIGKEITTRSDADISNELNELRNEQKTIAQSIDKLEENESKMAEKLQPLARKTTVTLLNLNLPVTEAVTPTPTHK